MPKIFIVIILLLIAAGVGLWYFAPGDDGENDSRDLVDDSGQSAGSSAGAGGSGFVSPQTKGQKARALLLINPQAFPENADVAKIAQSQTEFLNQSATLRKLLQAPACQNLPADLMAEIKNQPGQFIQAKADGNSSFIELDAQSGAHNCAGQLAQAVAEAYIEYARTQNLLPNAIDKTHAVLLTRVVPLD